MMHNQEKTSLEISSSMEKKKVGIIGAGISGLLSCKYVLQKGLEPIVFEMKGSIGGIWTTSIDESGSVGKHPKEAYQFSDFPWPPNPREEYPNKEKVFKYIDSYTKHFNLVPYIRFNSRVVGIDYMGVSDDEEIMRWRKWGGSGMAFSPTGKWEITIQDTLLETTHVYEVDFVIVSIGKFKNTPKYPVLPAHKGKEVFKGNLMHSIDFLAMDEVTALEMVDEQKVVVIGTTKTAMDIATQCASENGPEYPCTLIISDSTKNGHTSDQDYSDVVEALSDDLQNKIEDGSVILKTSSSWGFCENGVILEDQDIVVEASIVILATGYEGDRILMNMFKSPIIKKFIGDATSGVIHLYRECIHARIPHLAIIGISEGWTKIYSSEMKVQWLARFLEGRGHLPSIEEMEENMHRLD